MLACFDSEHLLIFLQSSTQNGFLKVAHSALMHFTTFMDPDFTNHSEYSEVSYLEINLLPMNRKEAINQSLDEYIRQVRFSASFKANLFDAFPHSHGKKCITPT